MSTITRSNHTYGTGKPNMHAAKCCFAMVGPPSRIGCSCVQRVTAPQSPPNVDQMAAAAAVPAQPAPASTGPQEIEYIYIPESPQLVASATFLKIELPPPPISSPPSILPSAPQAPASEKSNEIEYIYVPGSPELATSPNFPDINPSPIHTPPIPNLTPSCSSSSGLSSGPVTPSPTMAGPVRSVREPRTPRSRRPYDREGRDILAAPRKADRATIRRRLRKLDELFELEDSLAPRQPAKRVSRKRSKATDIPIPVFPRKVVKKEVTKSESTTRPNLAPPVGPPTGRTHPTGFNWNQQTVNRAGLALTRPNPAYLQAGSRPPPAHAFDLYTLPDRPPAYLVSYCQHRGDWVVIGL